MIVGEPFSQSNNDDGIADVIVHDNQCSVPVTSDPQCQNVLPGVLLHDNQCEDVVISGVHDSNRCSTPLRVVPVKRAKRAQLPKRSKIAREVCRGKL